LVYKSDDRVPPYGDEIDRYSPVEPELRGIGGPPPRGLWRDQLRVASPAEYIQEEAEMKLISPGWVAVLETKYLF
jgi:hypothetical protein